MNFNEKLISLRKSKGLPRKALRCRLKAERPYVKRQDTKKGLRFNRQSMVKRQPKGINGFPADLLWKFPNG